MAVSELIGSCFLRNRLGDYRKRIEMPLDFPVQQAVSKLFCLRQMIFSFSYETPGEVGAVVAVSLSLGAPRLPANLIRAMMKESVSSLNATAM